MIQVFKYVPVCNTIQFNYKFTIILEVSAYVRTTYKLNLNTITRVKNLCLLFCFFRDINISPKYSSSFEHFTMNVSIPIKYGICQEFYFYKNTSSYMLQLAYTNGFIENDIDLNSFEIYNYFLFCIQLCVSFIIYL